MVRSPRVQRALLASLGLLLAVSGVAFASTAGAQMAWQQRDAISLQPTGYEVTEGDDPTVRVSLRASNPTGIAATVGSATLVLYDGNPNDAQRLSVPRSASIEEGEVTVPAGSRRTLTVVVDVPDGGTERVREAIDEGRVVASGSALVRMRGRSYYADI